MKLRNKKTGEVKEFNEIYLTKTVKETNTATSEYVERSYCKIAELIADWEDVEPAEPLIKDEKIRKAVRAWAEVNSIKEALYAVRTDGRLCVLTDMGDEDFSIEFVGWIPTLKDGEVHTIAELCGEDEE